MVPVFITAAVEVIFSFVTYAYAVMVFLFLNEIRAAKIRNIVIKLAARAVHFLKVHFFFFEIYLSAFSMSSSSI